METNVNYTVIGGFVIALFAMIVLCIIWLSSGLSIESTRTYLIYMDESVSGLSQDSPVEYNGVDVGNVTSMKLNPKNPHLVEIIVDLKKTTPITNGTRAMLKFKGLTGVAVLALKDDGNDPTPLEKTANERYPVIPTIPSFYFRLDSMLTKLTKSIQSLLDKENLHSFKQILNHLDQITGTLARNSQHINTTLKGTAEASQELPILLQTFNSQTIPLINQISNNLSVVSDELKRNPSILLRGTTETKLGPGEK